MKAIIASSGGCKAAAAKLELNQKKFENHAYGNGSSRPLTDAQIYKLEQDAGTTHFPTYIAGIYGGLFVPLADPDTLDNIELFSRSVQVAAKRGTVDQIIAQSLDDGSISSDEVERILTAHHAHLAARHESILATISLYRKPGAEA
ncbi:YmfL family putative regulatory protein [Pseudomonas sp. StFLB209]|uniref:YmfL family putative regulatory protein n=1 Tax=Pseudomonas sp. StFLB209 TaxID=1028989 RepID=UPI003FA7493B